MQGRGLCWYNGGGGDPDDTGGKIRSLRREKGLSQEKLAEQLNVSRQAVAKWESGQSFPSTENLLKLAEIFGPGADLLPREEQAPNPLPDPSPEKPPVQKGFRTNLLAAGIIVEVYLLFYLAGRLGIGFSGYSVLGWLTEKSSGVFPYLYGWLLRGGLLLSAILSAAAALLGKRRLAGSITAGFLLGYLLGEFCGQTPAGAPYGQSHLGWAIWGGVFLLSWGMGALLERKKYPFFSRAFWIWAGGFLAGAVILLLLIRLGAPVPTGS